jgi:transcription initiation factor TFIID subunit 2
VRIAAFDGLFLTKWYTPAIMRYILAVMANDASKVVRRHVARNACYSLALLVQMGEMKATAKESESLLIEEDGNSQEKTKESKKSELDSMIKVLRKDREVGKNEALREFLMPIALYVIYPGRVLGPRDLFCSTGIQTSITKLGGAS